MKTKTNLPEPRTLDDLVFENRNKAYGAYALNRKHRKYLLIAFLISLTGVGTAIAVPFLKALNGKDVFNRLEKNVTITIDRYKTETVIPPPPPPPLPTGELDEQVSYKPPIVVEDAPEENVAPMSDLVDRTSNRPVVEDIPDPVTPGPEITEPPEPPMISPQEFASFMNGDLDDFRIWVQKNVTYPQIAIENRISGKVFIAFCVSKNGEVVDIELLRGVDKSIDQETIRVISSSPLWKAARQGGRPVKQKFVIPVAFILN
jgi:periplasmic protein TonB